ncbi:MAG TPA: glycoside hydrolase family 13 protein, partial [Anaerolineaceae bacterium]|nr:glycoside hydrolase family 13 protein [Anaerolineaceae bacterium]
MTKHLNVTPDWVKNAVFYQIFPDRFAWSPKVEKPSNFEPWDSEPTVHGFKGGDLMGVVEKLDYLQDLGINAIYFNPIFQSASNHRYHTHDYYQVDPLLGGNEAFKLLVEEAHKRDIKIVLDGVFNHASRGFFQFNHIMEVGKDSPYVDWFHIHDYPLNAFEGKPNYECWWGLPALPKLNTDNPQVRRYIFDIARYWIEQGADGWRLDVPFEIDDDEFWREFRDVVKTANPEAYIVGEIPCEAQRWMAGDQFDAVMNYQITHAALGFFGGKQIDYELASGMMGLGEAEKYTAENFAKRTEELLQIYPYEFALAQMNLLDSHDMPRFLSLVSGNVKRLALAYLFILTYPGAPSIYYGDEIGLTGGKDPECRKTFPWDESEWNTDLRDQLKSYIALRNANPVLRTGAYKVIYAHDGVIAYTRKNEEQTMLVILNANDAPKTVTIPTGDAFAVGTKLKSQLSDRELVVTIDGIEDLELKCL